MSTLNKNTKNANAKSSTSAARKRVKGGAKSATNTLVTSTPGATPPATDAVPVPPADWVAKPVGRGHGTVVSNAQVTSAGNAASELVSTTTYTDDFGPHAPSQSVIGDLISGASQWKVQLTAAQKWEAYANSQNAAWWQATFNTMDVFEPAFTYASSRDSSIAERYPALTKFMTARAAVGAKALQTRKANAAKERKTAKEQAAGTPPPTASQGAQVIPITAAAK